MKTPGGLFRKYTYLEQSEVDWLEQEAKRTGQSGSLILRQMLQERMSAAVKPAAIAVGAETPYADYVRHRAQRLAMTPQAYLEHLVIREMDERPPTELDVRAALRQLGELDEPSIDTVLARLFPQDSPDKTD